MSFKSADLSVLSYANNFTLWHYVTKDTLADIMQPGYFNNAGSMLRECDALIVNTKDFNTMLWIYEVVGTTNTNRTTAYIVTVTNKSIRG